MARTVGGIVPLNGPWIPERLKQAAEVIAEDARILSAAWSERVPPSVRVYRPRRGGLGMSVTISAGGGRGPIGCTDAGYRGGGPGGRPVRPQGDRANER